MIKFCTNFETTLELLGTITIGRKKNYFHNVTIEKVQAPIEYSRVLGTIEISAKSIQKKFLEGINDKRFIELQKATGAYQGENT